MTLDFTQLPPHIRRVVFAALLIAALHAPFSSANDSLARHVPANIGLFAEIQDAEDLLVALTEPEIWLSLAALAGQPAETADIETWRERIRATINMEPEEAIRALFARRVAFIGQAPGRAQDAAVLCRPQTDAKELLTRWGARQLPHAGRASVYRLRGNLGLAVSGNVLWFGDPVMPDGAFQQVLNFVDAARERSLIDDAAFRALIARVPPTPQGILFARLPQASPTIRATSQPSSAPDATIGSGEVIQLPGPLRNASNVLLALHRDGALLHLTAAGDASPAARPSRRPLIRLVENLPEETLIGWGGHIDYAALFQAGKALPKRNVFRFALLLQERTGGLAQLSAALDSPTVLALGTARPASSIADLPPSPVAAVLIGVQDAGAAQRELDALIESTIALYNLLALANTDLPQIPPPDSHILDGVEVRRLDLSGVLGNPAQAAFFGSVEFCWTVDEDAIVLASNLDWLRRVLSERRGQHRKFAQSLAIAQGRIDGNAQSIVLLRTGAIATLGSAWLAFIEQTAPHMLNEAFWRNFQPGGRAVRLGVTVTELADQKSLRVDSVLSDSPASGILRPGDLIVGSNNRRFATDAPVEEFRDSMQQRPHARWLDVLVNRGERSTFVRRVPLPFLDPVQIVRRMVAVGKLATRVVYFDDLAADGGPLGRLTIELRQSAAPDESAHTPVP